VVPPQPANLQGIWNEDTNPSWDSKYTVDINLPMNYWPAPAGNLFDPQAAFIEEIYPLMKDAVTFILDILVEPARHGWLVTAPSNSMTR